MRGYAAGRLLAMAAGMFATMDANNDERVSAAEMDAAYERVTGRKARKGDMAAADKIKVIDTSGEGILTADEHAAGSRTMFDAMDKDKDGVLSKVEMEAGHARMLRRPAQTK